MSKADYIVMQQGNAVMVNHYKSHSESIIEPFTKGSFISDYIYYNPYLFPFPD